MVRRVWRNALVVVAVLLVSGGGPWANGAPVRAAAALCSCPDCPDPIAGAETISIGTVHGWDFARDSNARPRTETVGEHTFAHVVAKVVVEEQYRGEDFDVVVLSDRLGQDPSGEFVWNVPGWPHCTGFRGNDPSGQRVAIATGLRVNPDDDSYWQLLAMGDAVPEARAQLIRSGLEPRAPAVGTGLRPAGDGGIPLQGAGLILLALSSITVRRRKEREAVGSPL